MDDPTWAGLGRGLLVVGVLWWAWASYAWLTNAVDADHGVVLAVMLVATAALFVAALAVPEAFASHRLVFALAFLVVLVMFVGLFAIAGRVALVAAVWVALHAYELIWWREARAERRATRAHGP